MKEVIKILFNKKINKILSYVIFINLFIYILIDAIFNWVSFDWGTEGWFLLQVIAWLVIIISIFIFLIYNKFYKTFVIIILFIVLLSILPFVNDFLDRSCDICFKMENIIGYIFVEYLSPLHNLHWSA